MKNLFKILTFIFIFTFLLVGCGSNNSKDILSNLDKKISNIDSYFVTGIMEIMNNEDTYTYDVTVSYKKDNYYKIDLINTLNNHEQVILRNDDGVYVVTPSLNKSFKFQSDWPYNNSQVYLLDSIIQDLKSDAKMKVLNNDKYTVFNSLVNYPNNKSLYKQNVYVDKKNNISKVEVVDKDNKVQISMKFDNIKYNKKFDDDYFELSNLITINKDSSSIDKNSNNTNNSDNTNNSNNSDNNVDNSNDTSSDNKTKETTSIDDVIYPMYLPDNTSLANKEIVNTSKGERLILTFDGDNPFVLVEEASIYEEDGLVIPVSGEMDFLTDVIGVVNDNSLTWESNGFSYYLVSNSMETSELIDIARSISVIPVSK